MNRYEKFVTTLGFADVTEVPTKKDKAQLRAFTYKGFDPQMVKARIGRPRDHAENLLVWSISRDKALRVDSEKCVILLGNGKPAVRALLASVATRKE